MYSPQPRAEYYVRRALSNNIVITLLTYFLALGKFFSGAGQTHIAVLLPSPPLLPNDVTSTYGSPRNRYMFFDDVQPDCTGSEEDDLLVIDRLNETLTLQ